MTPPITLVSLDPGLRMCGVAVFKYGVLTWAGLVENPNTADRGAVAWESIAREVKDALSARAPRVGVFVHETMQSYSAKHQKGDQNDLLELAGVAGFVGGLLNAERAVSYLPREWKGSVPKKVHQKRILSKLTPTEQDKIEGVLAFVIDGTAPEKAPVRNTVDAVGIGLFQLGRLQGTTRAR